MRIYQNKIIALFCTAMLLFAGVGCEYDVAEPQWEQPYTPSVSPVITAISPAQIAGPGVNLITITGTDFASSNGFNDVYFDNLRTEVVTSSPTTIVVRRPNLVSDNCVVKVVSSKAFLVAKKEPYTITNVFEQYGSFIENTVLAVVAVDQNENIYVVDASSTRNIIKVTPEVANLTECPLIIDSE